MRILILYSEISGYFLAGLRKYHARYGGEIHLVRWPLNSEAPFQFGEIEGVQVYERREYEGAKLIQLCKKINPQVVYVSGWLDKGYLKVATHFKKQGVPVICAMDNQWTGTLRQHAATWLSPFMLKPRFTHFWVPGLFQYEYARRLGYPPANILTGMYAADTGLFHQAYADFLPHKQASYPRVFLYVARLVPHKGIRELIAAYKALRAEAGFGWTLRIVGAGELQGKLPTGEGIEYLDFVQPEDLPGLAKDAGAFVLPSTFEPWGVALHEFAAAGLPLIASRAVGAATAFLCPGYNGFYHKPGDVASLKSALRKMAAQSDAQLLTMGQRSMELSKQISDETWAATLHSVAMGEI